MTDLVRGRMVEVNVNFILELKEMLVLSLRSFVKMKVMTVFTRLWLLMWSTESVKYLMPSNLQNRVGKVQEFDQLWGRIHGVVESTPGWYLPRRQTGSILFSSSFRRRSGGHAQNRFCSSQTSSSKESMDPGLCWWRSNSTGGHGVSVFGDWSWTAQCWRNKTPLQPKWCPSYEFCEWSAYDLNCLWFKESFVKTKGGYQVLLEFILF